MATNRTLARLAGVAAAAALAFAAVGVVVSPDPLSSVLRRGAEGTINGYLESAAKRAREDRAHALDLVALGIGAHVGIAGFWCTNPEAGRILWHALHGHGEPLVLPPEAFRASPFISSKVMALGDGEHGPISFRQEEDWALSLALNPFFLRVDAEQVTVFHPNVEFAPAHGALIHTIVPVGLMRIRVYDNLVSAVGAVPFEVSATWPRNAPEK